MVNSRRASAGAAPRASVGGASKGRGLKGGIALRASAEITEPVPEAEAGRSQPASLSQPALIFRSPELRAQPAAKAISQPREREISQAWERSDPPQASQVFQLLAQQEQARAQPACQPTESQGPTREPLALAQRARAFSRQGEEPVSRRSAQAEPAGLRLRALPARRPAQPLPAEAQVWSEPVE